MPTGHESGIGSDDPIDVSAQHFTKDLERKCARLNCEHEFSRHLDDRRFMSVAQKCLVDGCSCDNFLPLVTLAGEQEFLARTRKRHYEGSDPPEQEKPIGRFTPAPNTRQVGGEHYGLSAFQHWDIVAMFDLDYFQGQITKYVMRHKKKHGLEDLKKAQHFLEKYIDLLEQQQKPSQTVP